MTPSLAETPHSRRRILIVAGEASADRYGAKLVERLKAYGNGSELEFFGAGGDKMEQSGVRLVGHARDLGHIGPHAALTHLRRYYQVFSELVRVSASNPPAVAVLLDFPDFNLRLAKKLKRAGVPVIYYISPQIWAWRRGRIRSVRKYVDRMLVILPFEEEFYRRHGVRVEFVGHPILEEFAPDFDRESFLHRVNLEPDRTTLALLPGSRRKEIDLILPTLLRAAELVMRRMPVQTVVSVAPTIDPGQARGIAQEIFRENLGDMPIRFVAAESSDILANADFAMVKSGTCTLEAALVGTPFLVAYRISPASWRLGRLLIRTPFKGLVNLIAGEEVVPEYFQEEAKPERLSQTALEYLTTPRKAEVMRQRLAGVRGMLSVRCASDTVAERVKSYL